MPRIGLKLWNLNVGSYRDLARDFYEDGLFDYIELYIVPHHQETLQYWRGLKIPFDVHAPHSAHGMNLSCREREFSNRELYDDTRMFADELDARYIVFHGGVDGSCEEVARQLSLFNDSRTLIENKPHKPLAFVKAVAYVGSKPDEMDKIIKTARCGYCLDIGHAICSANSFGEDPYKFIMRHAALSPKKIHLSDIHIETEEDEHLNFGTGSLCFQNIKGLLASIGDITIETNKKSKTSLDDFVEDVKFIHNLFKAV